MAVPAIDQTCKRCSTNQAVLVVRTDALCAACFTTFISTKVVKRMEAFRTRHSTAQQKPRLLLPLSFGISSCSLLEILDRHLQVQKQRTRITGYSLQVLHIDQSSITGSESEAARMEAVKERFPEHTYSVVPLSNVFRSAKSNQNTEAEESDASPDTARFHAFLDALPSATSRADIMSLFLVRAVVQFAKENSCEGILWGDSTTRIAEKVLSESAKGRGFSLPWQVSDGQTPYGVPFYYPLRDALKKEILSYASLATPSLTPLLMETSLVPTQAPVSSRNTTIDMLMKQYFESVEESYPSIVSNVVRTSSRLQPLAVGITRCRLCTLPVTKDQLGIGGWEGNQDSEGPLENNYGLCYGCSRTMTPEAASLLP